MCCARVCDSETPPQVARRRAEQLPLEGSLGQVAAAARVSVGALQGEATELSASCAELQCLLDSLSKAGPDQFIEVGCPLLRSLQLPSESVSGSETSPGIQLCIYASGYCKIDS